MKTLQTKKGNYIRLQLMVLLTLGFFVSCSNDDDVLGDINESFIIGTWQLSNVSENGINRDLHTCEQMKTLTFDNTTNVVIRSYELNSTNECNLESTTTYEYTVVSRELTITNERTAEIQTPDNTTLILETNGVIKTYRRQ